MSAAYSPELNAGKPARARGQRLLIVSLFLVAVISYVDRGSLSIAAPLLSQEMGLTPVQLGVLLSSFFWSYASLQIPGGWLVDRYPVGWVLAVGVAVWSLATLASGFATTMDLLIITRLLLGAGEAVLFPCLSKAVSGAFPPHRRGLPNSIIDAGAKLGPALGVLVGGLMVARSGWRALFITLGVISLAWLIPWMVWTMRYGAKAVAGGPAHTVGSPSGPTLLDILRCRDFWGVTIGSSAYSYAFYFLLTWLPTYLVRERHLSMQAMAFLGSAPFWGAAAASLATGWTSDFFIRRGASQTVVRKTAVSGGLLLSVIALPAVLVRDVGLSVWLISAAYIAFGIFGSNFWAISQTLAGERAAGKWIGTQNAISALTGIAAPLATGMIVEKTGRFQLAFLITAVMAVMGAASYAFVTGAIEPIDWSGRAGRRSQDAASAPEPIH